MEATGSQADATGAAHGGGGDTDAVARGRPRDADRTTAILDAAVTVMYEVGWDGFKVQEVANAAGAGLATIYRRWPTKEDLVAAAMRHDMSSVVVGSAADSSREALVQLLTELGDKMSDKGGSVISVLAAARYQPVMREAFEDTVHAIVRVALVRLIEELVGDGDPMAVTLTDSIVGALIFRAGMLEIATPGVDFADEMLQLVDAVALRPD